MANVYYFVDGAVVRKHTCTVNKWYIDQFKKWKDHHPKRAVYAEYTNKFGGRDWYIAPNNFLWKRLDKQPKIIQMAQLIDAIEEVSMEVIKSEISSDPFFK